MLDDKYLSDLVKGAAEFGNGKLHIIGTTCEFAYLYAEVVC